MAEFYVVESILIRERQGRMAEFCKKCFIEKLLSTEDQKLYEQHKLNIVESKSKDLCEGCGKFTTFVLEVKKMTNCAIKLLN